MSHTRCFIGTEDCRESVQKVWEEEGRFGLDTNNVRPITAVELGYIKESNMDCLHTFFLTLPKLL